MYERLGRPRPRRRAITTAVVTAIVALPALAACGPGAADSGKPRVVTSFYALEYVAQRIAGNRATVTNLTHPGVEPHDLELKVQQIADVADADVVVYEKGFQAAVDEAVEQEGPDHVVDAAVSARLEHDDPHFWLDPTRMADVAGDLKRQLVAVDPDHAAVYERNLRSLKGDLDDLDHDIENGLSDCTIHTVVVSHDAFGYFGRRYGLDMVAINGLSPDAEPSLAHIRELQDLVRSTGITTVFAEELASRKLADTLAHDLGVKSAVLDPIEGLDDQTADQDYLSLMRRNLAALEEANRCS
jgi:zinc transport system substrate-binding protein